MSRTVSAALLALVITSGCGAPAAKQNETPPAPKAEAPAVVVDPAPKLYWDYAENAAAADLKYTGKIVELRVAGRVGKDERGRYFVGCIFPGEGVDYQAVVCYLAPAAVARAAAAQPGSGLRICGRCLGRRDDERGYQGFLVVVEGCKILDVLKGGE